MADIFCKGPDSNSSWPWGPKAFVTAQLRCDVRQQSDNTQGSERAVFYLQRQAAARLGLSWVKGM